MFGYDDAELTRIRQRRTRRLRPVVVVLELLLAALLALPFAVLDAVYRPGGLQPILDRATASAPFRLTVGDVVMLPVGRWSAPRTWRLRVTDLASVSPVKRVADWHVHDGILTFPSFHRDGDGRWTIHWDELWIAGLDIVTKQQQPPIPWEPARPAVAALTADRAHIVGATFFAPHDAPLPEVAIRGMRAELEAIRYDPGEREVSGAGSMTAEHFRTGAIEVVDIVLPTFRLERSSLFFEGDASFGGQPLFLDGKVEVFHIRPDVTVDVRLEGAAVDSVVRTATGRGSPVDGRLDLRLTVRSGGDLPRGGAVMTGDVVLREGTLQLADNTRYVVLDVIRILPWVKLDAAKRVVFQTMRGGIRVSRGAVRFQHLEYPVGRRSLRLDGTIDEGDLHLMIRLLPPADPDTRPGLGMIVEGETSDLGFRIAEREELLSDRPWEPLSPEALRQLRDAQRERLRAR